MRCPNCGLEMTESSLSVCPRCGYALAAPPARDAGADGGAAGWGAPPSTPLGGPPSPYQAGPYPSGPYGASPSQPLAPGQTAPGGWPPPSPSYGAPGFGMPGQPSGYVPSGQAGPPSMPLAPGQTYPGYPGYPGYVPLPPKPAKKRGWVPAVVGALVAVVLVAAAVGGLYVLGQSGASPSAGAPDGSTPAIVTSPGVTPTPTEAVLYADSLTSGAQGWSNGSTCYEKSDGYHIRTAYSCFAPIGEQGDVHITVDVKQISGPTTYAYGIMLRHPSQHNFYLFGIDSDSKWVFLKCIAGQSACTHVVEYTEDPHIHGGLNQVNTLSVVAKGTQFTFYVNGALMGHASDATFSSGVVGLSVLGTAQVEAVFTNLTVSKPA